ncbi:MAG TPA: sulfatase-like hydrolase/transferase, partial [Solirubrobacterales bacterium]|nr:sulfatase-like hydrolase/transferase [Solirubrobacterales bacterium]
PCDGRNAQPPGGLGPDAEAELPRPPSFNEKDTSARPSLADHPDRMGRGDVNDATQAWRCGLAAMRAVDDELTPLLAGLERSGTLANTVVVYLSDNGYYYGEHRLTEDKRLPLEAALRVPMAIRVGSAVGTGRQPAAIGELVSQVDLAPTLLDYAGADSCPAGERCPPLDGRSLRKLLRGSSSGWPADRAIPLSLDDGWTYEALRTRSELYMEITAARKRDFESPQQELYDLGPDPDQLVNLAAEGEGRERERLDRLQRRLARLVRCAGIRGRDADRGRPYCD